MPNARTANAVRMEFVSDSLVQSNLSGAAFTGDWRWVAGDEACGLDLDALHRQQPPAAAAVRCGAGGHPGRYARQQPDVVVLSGDITQRARPHKNGEVSAAQIDRAAKLLAAASPFQLRVVVVHQPVAVTQARDRPNLLRGGDAAVQVGSAAGADLVMGGHIHLPYTLALPGLTWRLWVVQAGTAVSSRTRPEAPHSVNLVRWGKAFGGSVAKVHSESEAGSSCLIERWDFSHPDRVFVRTAVTPVQPDRP